MRVLVAPDKFKGSLTAGDVAEHLSIGLTSGGAHTTALPLADGGDGSVDAAIAAGFTPNTITVAGATGTPQTATIAHRGDTAVVEVANTCGLGTLPLGRRSPLEATSLGMGQAVKSALRHQPRRLVLALGGSASTDGGTGLLSALGYIFRNAEGRQVRGCGRRLTEIHTVDTSQAASLTGLDLVIAGDVTNPLTGPTGTAAVYGPQKGADPDAVHYLDEGLNTLVAAFARSGYTQARELADTAGAGSAGGLGFAALLLGARMASGAEYFLDLLDFEQHLAGTDLVVTGEGSIDEQTEHGKLLSVLARRAQPVPVIVAAGRNTLPRSRWHTAGFSDIRSLTDYTGRDTSRDPELTAQLLVRIGRDIALDNAADTPRTPTASSVPAAAGRAYR